MGEGTDQAIRDIVRGAGIVYVGLVLQMGVAFLAQILAARYLSIGGFGGLTTGTALLNVGAIVGGLGFSSGLTRYLPRIEDGEKRHLTYLLLLGSLPVAIVLGGVISLNAEFIAANVFGDPTVAVSVAIFGAVIPFSTVLNLGIGGIRGLKVARYKVYVQNLLKPITRFGLVIIAVLYGLDQAGFAGAYAIPYVVSAVVALYLLHRALPRSSEEVEMDRITEVVRYSLPFTISGLTSFVYRSIDIFLILFFLDSRAVGIYGVAYAAVRLIGMFATAFNFLGTSVASEIEKEEGVESMLTVYQSVMRWLVVPSVSVLALFALFPGEFISIVYRPGYAEGALALTILAIGFVMKNILGTHNPILQAIGKSKQLAFNNVAAAVSNVGLNLYLIPRYGIEGAAIATVASFLVRDLLSMVEVRHYTGSTTLSKEGLSPLAVAVPIFGIAAFVTPSIPGTFLWIAGFMVSITVLYVAGVIVVLGFTPQEVMIVRSIEEKYGVNIGPIDTLVRRFGEE
jgi:O-antigen/teichoic acid export membrane protein